MRKFLIIILEITFFCIPAKSFNYDIKYTTGIFTGTPFWNYENFTGEDSIKLVDKYLRFYNNLRIKSQLFDNFDIKINGLRSDNISGDNIASETKLYEVYANYKHDDLNLKVGRFSEFNKWTMGSVDGAAINYEFSNEFKISGYTGLDVKYSKIFDENDRQFLAYADLNYRGKNYGGKLKYYHSDEIDLTGIDIFTKFLTFAITANLGYDLTESKIHDGGLAISGYASKSLRLFANYSLIRPWMWNGYFNPEQYQRFQLGFTYQLPWYGLSLSGIQMLTSIEDLNTSLSYIALNYKFASIGLNYMKADLNYKRLGISIGGNYSPLKNLNFSLGISSVDFIMNEQYFPDTTSATSLASYLKIGYKFFDNFAINIYANYFDTDKDYPENLRAGATIQYHIGGKNE